MQELLVDFITSLDGYGAAKGWPGWWGLQGPEYLGWLSQTPEREYTILMGANTYRLMSGFAAQYKASATGDSPSDEETSITELANASKVVFSATLRPPVRVAQYPADQRGGGRGRASGEARRRSSDAHAWQPGLVSFAPHGRSGGPLPGRRLPRDHRKHRLRPGLRRLSRCGPRYGRQPHV